MKKILILMLLISAAHCHAGWFGHDDYKDQWQQSQEQLEQQRHATGDWQIVAGILGTACMALLIVGAAIGAKARKAVKHE